MMSPSVVYYLLRIPITGRLSTSFLYTSHGKEERGDVED
jgi:hypothetical protein